MRGRLLIAILIASVGGGAGTAAAQGSAPSARRPAGPAPGSPFLGGVPSGTLSSSPLSLTVAEVIARALQHNLGVLNAEHDAGHADGARAVALSQLLPNIGGRVTETRQELNLAAFGFPRAAGAPAVVGPFNVFDARVYVSQSLVDLRAINEVRKERHLEAAAQQGYKSARDLVVLVASNAYLQAIAAGARVESAQAQLRTAQAIASQAQDLKSAGLVAGIDVLRAEVQVSTERQRATAATNELEKARLQIAQIIGLPIGQAFTLADQIPSLPAPAVSLDEAVDRAYKTRPDYLAALERVRAAEADRKAALGESLPSVRVTADYGAIGPTARSAEGTFAVMGAVNVPIFQGGRARGHLLEANADLRTRRAEAENMKASIYYEVRAAQLDVASATEQMDAATRGRELAAQQLVQARDRFTAGVANNLEIVQAQEAVALANEHYIAAQYGLDVAKAVFAHSLGTAEEAARQFLGDIR